MTERLRKAFREDSLVESEKRIYGINKAIEELMTNLENFE